MMLKKLILKNIKFLIIFLTIFHLEYINASTNLDTLENIELENNAPILVSVLPNFCNATLPYILSTITSSLPNLPDGVVENGYKFYVKNLTTGQEEEVFRTIRNFKLTMTSIYEYSTSYEIKVAVKVNDVWQPYGLSCIVSTPYIPNTQVTQNFCGTSLPLIFSSINANSVNSALTYRFKIINTLNPLEIQTYESLENRFNLTMLTEYPILYNTSYLISVQVKVVIDGNEIWSNYGSQCEVITPRPTTTQITINQCEYQAITMSDIMVADAYPNASLYKYKLENEYLSYQQTKVRSSNMFALDIFNGLLPNTTYTISISLKYAGVWGPYGKSCDVTTPNSLRIRESKPIVSIYPNPFVENCFINIESELKEVYNITVYNSLGLVMDQFEMQSNTETLLTKNGFSYPSGLYKVVLMNENDIQNFTIVKK